MNTNMTWQKITNHIDGIKHIVEKRKKAKTFFMKIIEKKWMNESNLSFFFMFFSFFLITANGIGVAKLSSFDFEMKIYIWIFSSIILFWMNLKVWGMFYNQIVPSKERSVKITRRIKEVLENENNQSLMNEIINNMDNLPNYWWDDLEKMSREYKIKKRNERKIKKMKDYVENETDDVKINININAK